MFITSFSVTRLVRPFHKFSNKSETPVKYRLIAIALKCNIFYRVFQTFLTLTGIFFDIGETVRHTTPAIRFFLDVLRIWNECRVDSTPLFALF